MRYLYSTMKNKEHEDEDQEAQPVSPTGQYFSSDALSIRILGILELEAPFDTSLSLPLLRDVFLPINPRFSSIMVTDENGQKQWKRVEVKLEDHIHIPIIQNRLSEKEYDEYFTNYISKLGMEQFSQCRPLWEVHVFNYPTSNAGGTVIFKLHHSLGDGYSLMGALLSCLRKSDNVNSTLPLTFPRFQRRTLSTSEMDEYFLSRVIRNVPRALSSVFSSLMDFGSSILKSSFVGDDLSPIRSGNAGVEFLPVTITTITFSLDRIKQIKAKLGVTVNDVICGVIFMGIRMYMQQCVMNHESTKLIESTALVLLNTRDINGYKSVEEMLDPTTGNIWGNKFAFLHVPIPQMQSNGELNPIDFVMKAHDLIQWKRNSFGVHLTGWFLELCRKYRGYEAVARYVHCTFKNASLCISNVMGPIEQMSLANHLVKGLYFMVCGSPQSLLITITSYMGELRVAIGAERGHIDSASLNLCTENAFELLFKATC